MTKLNFKYSLIRTRVIPSLIDTTEDLNRAIRVIDSMSIPASFVYGNQLRNIINSVKNINRDLNHVCGWLEDSNRILEDTLNTMNDSIKSIEMPIVKIKDSFVNTKE